MDLLLQPHLPSVVMRWAYLGGGCCSLSELVYITARSLSGRTITGPGFIGVFLRGRYCCGTRDD